MNLKIMLFLTTYIQLELLKEIQDHVKNLLTLHKNYM